MQLETNKLHDLDAISRNLAALDIAHLTPEEATDYEQELSALTSLNEALETATQVLRTAAPPVWQHLYPLLSDAAALLTSQLAPLLDTNAERSFPVTDRPVEKPLALAAHSRH